MIEGGPKNTDIQKQQSQAIVLEDKMSTVLTRINELDSRLRRLNVIVQSEEPTNSTDEVREDWKTSDHSFMSNLSFITDSALTDLDKVSYQIERLERLFERNK